ncbi:MAG TPA: MqnA/MqnD/SBP family protein [Thermomicrobiales bacterium]|nr:MqnA/MqnD/SBP family protein [Thermomicrobiales bacterium]
MRLLIDDALVTAPFVAPLAAGWVTPAADLFVEARPRLRAADVAPDDVALLPLAEVARLPERAIVPDFAVVADTIGAVQARTPVRPDEIERTPARLLDVSGSGELLARATLTPFYGIEIVGWPRDDEPGAAEAQVTVVEGIEALRPVEGGYAEDLCRAWFILVGLPFVSHVLVAPAGATRETLQPALATLVALQAAGEERRREWRAALAEREDVPRDRLIALFQALRRSLGPDEQKGINALFSRGLRGSSYPPVGPLRYLDEGVEGRG